MQILPDDAERLLYKVWPLYIIASPVVYYIDLVLDFLIILQYYEQGQAGDDSKRRSFIYSVAIFFFGIVVTCLFDSSVENVDFLQS